VKHPRLIAVFFIILSLFIVLLIPLILFLKPYIPFKDYLLGKGKPTSYLILLGNDTEMRANGGFVGSYARLVIANHEVLKQSPPSVIPGLTRNLYKLNPLKINFDLSFQDIYVPNGQLQGYVTPPAPIQEAFKHGSWELANADWEPDFPTSVASLRWFFEKGNEIIPDNLVLLNLTTIKKVLDVVGSFSVPEYNAQITPDNLYLFLQGKTEMNFFPGSTQKKDVLTAVGLSLKQAILRLPIDKKFRIARILYQDLVNQNIVINSTNEAFQNFLVQKNFAGKLVSNTADTYLLVEANLGANKANAYVTRQTTHNISFQNNQTTHQVTVKFVNSSPEANPNPPFQYGGNYIAYLRFYLPSQAQDIHVDHEATSAAIKAPPINTASKYGFTEIGSWQTTPAQNQTTINLSYTLPIGQDKYSLTILKQHGLVSSPQTINIGGKTLSTSLTNDYKITK